MNYLSIYDIEDIAYNGKKISISKKQQEEATQAYEFLKKFSKDKIIYGINTGFGPMAQYKIDDKDLNQLQYNLIRSHSSGIDAPLSKPYARAVMISRLNTFLLGNSGVSFDVINQLQTFLNNDITPEIFEHGSVGASGDLVQLAHLGLNLIGEGYVYVDGKRKKCSTVLKRKGITPLKLKLRDGLAIINGTSCMSGIAAINLTQAYRLFDWSIAASSMLNEIVSSFNDSFSKELNQVKLHKGQREVAEKMRNFLKESKLIKRRENYFFENDEAKKAKEFDKKVQEYYSIRCVPQILGPILDTYNYCKTIVEDELNSANDNPVIYNKHVFHGGNFHGDYISLEMDKLKIATTKLSMLLERQLNYLLNHKLNEKFYPFLNSGTLGLNFGYQGVQYPATSTTAENQTLSFPMYLHSISNNNDNQDIVSMGTNSALIARKVINNSFQVLAIHIMAICQAIDLLDEQDRKKLSPNTIKVYNSIRENSDFIKKDIPQFEKIAKVYNYLKTYTVI